MSNAAKINGCGVTVANPAPSIAAHPPVFDTHRQAALSLLNSTDDLTHKQAGFLGHVCVAPVLSDRQRQGLAKLLERYGMPPLADGDPP